MLKKVKICLAVLAISTLASIAVNAATVKNPDPKKVTKITTTTTEETTETTTAVALESQNKVTVDGADYYVATLEKPMSDYTFTFNGTAVTPTAVNAEKTIVKYSDNAFLVTSLLGNLTYANTGMLKQVMVSTVLFLLNLLRTVL